MPINNSYNQTPKRIFTNKPFIKGMNYTNADLEPFVCRAVANLELESSNSATKLRKGITNNILDTDQGLVYKFYKKYVIFTNLITETMYNNNITPTDVQSADLGIKVINEDKKENDIYGTIITNNTKLEYTTELNDSLDLFGSTADYKIYALVSDEGRLNHVINNQDYSFMFFGAIFKNTSIQYKGPIKLYYHVTAQKIIIEIIKPQTLDIVDVKADGVNIIASNPAIYKDWINYRNGPQYYSDYFGDTRAVTDENKNKAIIDITTVALYDAPVEPAPYNNSSNANMLVSIDKTKQDPFYIRPFYAIPNKKYGVMVTAKTKNNLEYIYNFDKGIFEYGPNTEVTVKDLVTNNFNISISETHYREILTITNIDADATATITANTSKTLFRLAASDTDVNNDVLSYFGFSSNSITSPNTNYTYRIVSSFVYSVNAFSSIYTGNVSDIGSERQLNSNITRINYLYRKSTMNGNQNICTHDPTNSTSYYKDDSFDFIFKVSSDGKSIAVSAALPRLTTDYSITNHDATETELRNNLTNNIYNTGIATITFREIILSNGDLIDMHMDANFNMQLSNNTSYNYPTLSGTISTEMPRDYINLTSEYGDSTPDYFMAFIGFYGLEVSQSSNTHYKLKVIAYDGDEYTYYIRKELISTSSNIPSSRIYTKSLIKEYHKIDTSETIAVDNLQQLIRLDLSATDTISAIYDIYDRSDYTNIIIKTPAAYTINEYDINDINDILDDYNVLVETLYSNNYTTTQYPISVDTTLTYTQLNKDYCHYINDNGYSIPINRSIADIIDTSTFKVTLFPYEELDESNVQYKSDEFVEKTVYSFGTNGEEIVDYSEWTKNSLFSNAVNMTNHLGHTVVWGDHTNSNSLYYSAFNDISYFPSNYVFTFDNPIVYAYPHRDGLVVFTTDDIYMLHSGNVPSTTATDGSEVAFTQSLIQANTRLGKQNIDTVRAIGKDLFFINNNNQGYLLKSNKYVSDVSDVYLIKLTSQIDDLLDNPYQYAKERYMKWYPNSEETSISSKLNTITKITDAAPSLDTINVPDTYEVVDGDTIKFDGQYYRLVYMDTPEVTTNERLAYTAKCILAKLMAQASNNVLYDTGKIDNSKYNRKLVLLMCDNIDVSATMLYNGLAEYYDSSYTEYENNLYSSCYSFAKLNQRGIHNNNKYTELTENDIVTFTEFDGSIDIYKPVWNTNSNELYCYTTNSYVYIIQAIKLSIEKAITIFYKYSIDAKVWTTYDIPTYIKPNDIIPDNNTVGFKILCNNDRRGKASLLEFKNSPQDVIQYKFTKSNDLGEYTLSADLKYNYINVYFDSGNQSISLMNDKLFREIKLLLGALPDSLLSMDYSIDFYTDGKLVIPNQVGNCDTHIHHRPINTHYKGSVENLEGFQKVTFFAPARGRIPRIVFSLTCESDINILEYAIVYMQLNAK